MPGSRGDRVPCCLCREAAGEWLLLSRDYNKKGVGNMKRRGRKRPFQAGRTLGETAEITENKGRIHIAGYSGGEGCG